MREKKKILVESIRKEFYSKGITDRIKIEIVKPTYKDLLFGFIEGPNKKMCVLDEESGTRYEY